MGQAAGLSNGVKNPAHSVSSRNGRTGFSGVVLNKSSRNRVGHFWLFSSPLWQREAVKKFRRRSGRGIFKVLQLRII